MSGVCIYINIQENYKRTIKYLMQLYIQINLHSSQIIFLIFLSQNLFSNQTKDTWIPIVSECVSVCVTNSSH